MVCDNHGRNYQIGDPPWWLLLRDSRELPTREGCREYRRKRLGVKTPSIQSSVSLLVKGTLTVGDEWEGIIYSLSQIIAPFGPELENSF